VEIGGAFLIPYAFLRGGRDRIVEADLIEEMVRIAGVGKNEEAA
jgi:hypothetical protein